MPAGGKIPALKNFQNDLQVALYINQHKISFMIKEIISKCIHAAMLLLLLMNAIKISAQNHKNKFVQIFDGKTLKGWEGDPTYWRVENGNLVGEITPSTLLRTNSFIIWREDAPADFELMLEFRITQNGNSGINYRSEQLKDVPYALRGYQADIDGLNRYTGQNYEERARTTLAYRGEKVTVESFNSGDSLKDFLKNNAWTKRTVTGSSVSSDSLQAAVKAESWNTCHLIIKGNRLQHFINGVLISDVTDNDTVNRKSKGLLGVQVHVGPPMKVEYRNIRLKQL